MSSYVNDTYQKTNLNRFLLKDVIFLEQKRFFHGWCDLSFISFMRNDIQNDSMCFYY